ncbi:MAG: ATPase, partial [Shewanella sp.]
RKLFTLNPVRFSMIGGLAEPLQAWLGSDVVAKISETLAPPELGAMYFAQQQFNSATV